MSVPTVNAPGAGATNNAGASGVTALSGAAATGNVNSLGTALAGILEVLQTGGGLLMDPSKRSDFDALNKSVDSATKKDLANIDKLNSDIATWQARVAELQDIEAIDGLSGKQKKELNRLNSKITDAEKTVTTAQGRVDTQRARITDWEKTNMQGGPTAADLLAEKFPEARQALDAALPYLQQAGQLGPAGQQLMDALNKGYQAQDVNFNNAAGAQSAATQLGAAPTMSAATANLERGQAANMGNVANVQAQQVQGAQANTVTGQAAQAGFVGGPQAAMMQAAQANDRVSAQQIGASTMGNVGQATSRDISAAQVGAGSLGQALMGRAMSGVQNAGRPSPEASRDAVQSARQSFAARGMVTGNAAAAAELLNRDRYRREREFQDLGFAQQVQGADEQRQFQNVGNQLTAGQANQAAAIQADLANLQTRYNTAVQSGDWQQAAAIQNQQASLQASMANQSAGQFNAQLAQGAAANNQSSANQMALAGYQGNISQNQFNAGNQQAMNLANLQALNQGNQFNAANQQQASLANQSAALAAAQGNQQTQFGTNQFNAGNQQAMNLANMQSANQMNQFNAGNQQAANQANMQMAGQFRLAQGELSQQNNQFNAANAQQNNQFNATGNFQAGVNNQQAQLQGAQQNLAMFGDAYNTQQGLRQEGLGAALMQSQMAGQANPYQMLLGMYGSGEPTGSQSISAGAGLGSTWAQNNLAAQGFNANAAASLFLGNQNLQAARMAANATQNAGMMGMWGGIGGGALAGVGLAI
jgi:hypothetical protein